MTHLEIFGLRKALGLSQIEFALLFDVHFMTVSKWERGILHPTPYQVALMHEFLRALEAKQVEVQKQVKHLLVGAGVIAAIFFLLQSANK